MAFVKALAGPPNVGDPEGMFTVQYFDEAGNMTNRSKGTRAWRCNNPGNLRKSRYSMSKTRKAIGFAGDSKNEYAVYPDKETGHESLVVMMRGSVYSPMTLRVAMVHFESERKDYIDIIVARTGLHPERTIESLSDKEFHSFWQAIEFVERWEEGVSTFIEKWIISGVHKRRGVICEYCIRKPTESVWLKKDSALALANEGRLHTVIVHVKNGSAYLRPEHSAKPFELIT